MRWWLAALAALVIVGGGLVVKMNEEQKRVRLALRSAASRFGLNAAILEAISWVESRWRMGATNLTGADGSRGGAWGPTQITETTARAHGYTGSMAALTTNADLAAEWTARIMLNRPGGAPKTIEDAAAWWNAGRSSAALLGPTHVTLTDYIPKAREAMRVVEGTVIA